jgi:1-phosphofructokinase
MLALSWSLSAPQRDEAVVIATVSPNPSIDRTVEVDHLERGATLRCSADHVDPGGKGLNLSRALLKNGVTTVAVFPAGGVEGSHLVALIEEAGVPVVPVPIGQPVRTNITVAEPDGTVTKLNVPGPALGAGEVRELLDAAVGAAAGAEWVAGCGSLPPGVPNEFYAELLDRLADAPCEVAIDSSGPAFQAALEHRPSLVKPNREELAEATGRSIDTLGHVVEAAEVLRARGVARVLVSLGADGAVLVDDAGATHGETAPITVRSAIGAGDAMLAGFLAAGGDGVKALANALAWGAAAASLPGSRMPAPADLEHGAVQVNDRLDGDRPLGKD